MGFLSDISVNNAATTRVKLRFEVSTDCDWDLVGVISKAVGNEIFSPISGKLFNGIIINSRQKFYHELHNVFPESFCELSNALLKHIWVLVVQLSDVDFD